jgi:hypothetical protein
VCVCVFVSVHLRALSWSSVYWYVSVHLDISHVHFQVHLGIWFPADLCVSVHLFVCTCGHLYACVYGAMGICLCIVDIQDVHLDTRIVTFPSLHCGSTIGRLTVGAVRPRTELLMMSTQACMYRFACMCGESM